MSSTTPTLQRRLQERLTVRHVSDFARDGTTRLPAGAAMARPLFALRVGEA